MEDLNITLVQSDLYWEDIEANLSMFEEKIWKTATATDLIVLPEMFTTGFTMDPKPFAELMNGKTHRWMRMMAEQTKAVIAGSYIIIEQNNFYNRLLVVFPDGTTHHYDKRHLFSPGGEDKNYTAGDKDLIFELKGWKIKTGICYDLRFPVWARSVKKEGALYQYDFIFFTSSWPVPRIHAMDVLLSARGIENLAYCAGVNRIGSDPSGATYTGHTAAYNFKGELLQMAKEDELISLTLHAEPLLTYRQRHPFQKDADQFELR